MTAVALPVTDAPASVEGRAQPEALGAEFALQIRLMGSGAAARSAFADLAQAILSLVGDGAPELDVRSTLVFGADGPEGEDVVALPGDVTAMRDRVTALRDDAAARRARADAARVGSATDRARTAWHASERPADRTDDAPGGLLVDMGARTVVVRGEPVRLTFKELALLEYLLRSPRRAIGRDELMQTVWRGALPAQGSRTIDVHVRRLRDKLGGCLEIVTVRGVGYRCEPTPDVVLVGSGDAG